MLEIYFIKNLNYTLGKIIRKDGVFSFELIKHDINEPEVQPNGYYIPFFYPFEFYRFGERDFDYPITHDIVKEFIDDRAVDPNRVGVDIYLRELGLLEYDSWEICKRSQCPSIIDSWWITADENQDYREVVPYNRWQKE